MDEGQEVSEGLRPSREDTAACLAMIEAAWPELHREVRVTPAGKHVGVLVSETTEKRIRQVSGVLFPFWRKLLTEAPIVINAGGLVKIELANQCNALLLVGNDVIREWRDDLLPQELWGRWGVMDGRWMVMPIQHPDTLSKGSAERWGEDVKRFFEGYVSETGTWGLSGECVKGTCGDRVWKYDRDGVAWCEKHWTEQHPEVKVKKTKAVRQGKIGERMIL